MQRKNKVYDRFQDGMIELHDLAIAFAEDERVEFVFDIDAA